MKKNQSSRVRRRRVRKMTAVEREAHEAWSVWFEWGESFEMALKALLSGSKVPTKVVAKAAAMADEILAVRAARRPAHVAVGE